ncbi:unnamed protein product [Heligmosomoides polygyrus]|uniref:Uncharacterized protein n=1 Tax=Heligmosomoides polygyrus TaxID=6339 RepID=A0A183FRD4_HELPZ|nr:unnamed protein product [Heligmosomoides polygyrus]
MPSLEPKQTGCWLLFVATMDTWLGNSWRLYLVARPIEREQSPWFRVAERARSHVHGYIEYRPEHAEQIVDKLPVSAGLIPADSLFLEVGIVDDDKSWICEAGMRKFYSKMADALSSWFSFEALPSPKFESSRPHNPPRGSEDCSKVVEGGSTKID